MRRVGLVLLFSISSVVSACGGGDDGDNPDRRIIEVPDAAALPDMGPPADASLFMEECSTTLQNCQDPANPKCTFISVGGNLETECLPVTGTLANGETCMRESEAEADIGHDNCNIGLWCSGVSLPAGPPQQRACRMMCSDNGHCTTAGEQCLSIDGTDPLDGFCLPTCTLFDAATCMTGMSCSIMINIDETSGMGICRMDGTIIAGNACGAVGQNCLPNMQCISDGMGGGVCANLCDGAHACPGGLACTAVPPLPNGGGFCQ
jgi:hypothetical protein